jgi:flagellar hook-associated protein 3 FlgL
MTPIGSSTPGTGWFLNGLANLQQEEAQTERELSSGYQVNDASDSPSQTPQLIQLGSTLATVQAYQENLGNVQTEASTADQAIGSSITLIQSAITIATQGASSTATAASNQIFADNIQGIQQQIVALANTTVAGRAIFGGNQDQSAPYQYDPTSAPTGVDTLTISTSNRAIVNPQGDTVYQSLTAQQIFDPVDATNAPTASNTFAALQSLQTALQSNDQTGIASALAALQTSSSYLNQQQAYYGAAEQRMTSEQNIAANQVTALQTQIGNIRDTNFAQAATDLATEQTDQAAAMGSEAEISPKSLFDYLG